MRPLLRVAWSEGMFLLPQHFQQLDSYHEGLLATRLTAALPNSWGVLEFALSPEALAAGQVQLDRFFGVLPEGLTLRFDRGDPEAPAARPVAEHFGPGERSLEVFLAVPKERADTSAGSSGNLRYALASRPVADLFSAEGTVKAVPFAQRRVQVLLGSESREDFETLQIAELKRNGMGGLEADPAFVPPVLRLDAAPFLMNGLQKLLGQLAAKQRVLADTRRAREGSSTELGAADVTRFLQLRALNVALPMLNHLLDAGDEHPYQAFLWLLQIGGELSAFDTEADPLAFPKFRFTDLGPTFAALFEQLDHLLAGLAEEKSLSVPLEVRPGGVYLGRLEDERFLRCTRFVLAVKSELPEKQVSEQLPRLSKIASPGELSRIVQAAAPGVPLQSVLRPPSEVTARPGLVYFLLATEDGYWKAAIRDRAVAIFLPQPFDPKTTKIELLALH